MNDRPSPPSGVSLPHQHHPESAHTFDHMPRPEAFAAAAEAFRLLADPTRMRLLWLLCHCEECVLNLSALMAMSSPALSHHLKLLKACGLASSRRVGREVYYRAAETVQADACHRMIEHMAEISCPRAPEPGAAPADGPEA